ncbi:transglycosylase domain-containing protein [Hydrogenophaga sp. 5NK40-0174]|uniref:transglycosylase domain-containing protein n=1 Tax=Hydrogenophaga sp. 5NK40-0174 TaxID=3127649 RepID=UPI003101DCB6
MPLFTGPAWRVVRRAWLLLLCVTIPLVGVGTVYFVLVVRQAHQDTPSIVHKAWLRHGHAVKLDALSEERLQWLLAVEDPSFFQHRGVDVSTPGAGMTTISQGLVKLLYFPEGFQPGFAKLRQTLIARYAFDAQVSKREQLALLLNMAYLGEHEGKPVRGFAKAARVYFAKPFTALSDEEYLSLVAMLMAPNRLKPGSSALADRLTRVHALLNGKYRPSKVSDVDYDGGHDMTWEQALFTTFVQWLALNERAESLESLGANEGEVGREQGGYWGNAIAHACALDHAHWKL